MSRLGKLGVYITGVFAIVFFVWIVGAVGFAGNLKGKDVFVSHATPPLSLKPENPEVRVAMFMAIVTAPTFCKFTSFKGLFPMYNVEKIIPVIFSRGEEWGLSKSKIRELALRVMRTWLDAKPSELQRYCAETMFQLTMFQILYPKIFDEKLLR